MTDIFQMEFEEEGLFSNYTDTNKNYSSDFLDDDISPITDFQSKKNITKKIESQPLNEEKENKKFGFSKEMENDKNYMKSKMMYFPP